MASPEQNKAYETFFNEAIICPLCCCRICEHPSKKCKLNRMQILRLSGLEYPKDHFVLRRSKGFSANIDRIYFILFEKVDSPIGPKMNIHHLNTSDSTGKVKFDVSNLYFSMTTSQDEWKYRVDSMGFERVQ